jgi:hypothetical protein
VRTNAAAKHLKDNPRLLIAGENGFWADSKERRCRANDPHLLK